MVQQSLLLDLISLLWEVIQDYRKDIASLPGINQSQFNSQIIQSQQHQECTQISANLKKSSKLNSKSMTIKWKDSPQLNQLLISFPRLFILVDFSHTIPSILLLDLTKMEKESFMVMMLLEVTEVIRLQLKVVVHI